MKNFYIVSLTALIISLGSCNKVVTDCTYAIKPLVQKEQGGKDTLTEGSYAYTFFADTTNWLPMNWTNAEKGILTSRTSSETKSYDVLTAQNKEGLIELGPLKTLKVIVIVCDPSTKIFAWRQLELVENLSYMFAKIRFRPWKPSKSYKEAGWTMVNEFAVEPTPDPTPDPPTPDPVAALRRR